MKLNAKQKFSSLEIRRLKKPEDGMKARMKQPLKEVKKKRMIIGIFQSRTFRQFASLKIKYQKSKIKSLNYQIKSTKSSWSYISFQNMTQRSWLEKERL